MKRILVVDDDGATRELMKAILGKDGFEVVEAGGAHHAREILARGPVDLIFLDEAMPGESGHEFCRFVKQSLGPAAPKVVILTAMEAQRDWQEGLEAGADVYAVKPFGGERIRLLARNLLGEGA
ncbi:MAG: response regulator [Holophagaceae bacterium]